ncbi:MAG: hypothetical protein ABI692_00835 [Terracoccus sp.]
MTAIGDFADSIGDDRGVSMMPSPSPNRLVLGPMLRYVGETEATVWVETAEAATVTVEADGRE